jgi:hypothetical protein
VQRPFGAYQKSDGFNINGASSWPGPGSTNFTTSSYQWTENGPSGPRFNATYMMALTNGPATTDAKLSQTLQISNPNPTALQVALFKLTAPQPGDGVGPFSAAGNVNSILVTNGVYDVTVSANGANAYKAVTDPSLGIMLAGGPSGDLNNTGLPVANYTPAPYLIGMAYEWMEIVPGNGSVTISDSIAISHAVPEPGTLIFCAGAAVGGCLMRWRRRGTRRGTVEM